MSHRNDDDDPRKRAAEIFFGMFVLSLLVWGLVTIFIAEYIDNQPLERKEAVTWERK